MKKEELEKKLKISEKTCIHCPTLELAIQVLSIFHQSGLRWKSETPYTLNHNWDSFKESTVYYPFRGECSSFSFANLTGYIIIRAEEFIALHTEEKEFNLENYEPKGELIGFPKEIIARMLNYQEEQGNPRDISVFEKQCEAGRSDKGFDWDKTQEGWSFWNDVIDNKNFNLFFEKYPKQDYQELKNNKKEEDSQEFRVGDKVIDIITRQIGFVKNINLKEVTMWKLEVAFEDCTTKFYSLEGKYYIDNKIPTLFYYRDDYNYNVIDFNNLPKRQEPKKRWRAEEDKEYYFVSFHAEGWFFSDESRDDYDYSFDNYNYNSGNYFQTKEEAQEVADKLKKHFQELINPNK